MVPDTSETVHVPAAEQLTLAMLLDALADRLATRLLAVFERGADTRALTLARLDLDTLRNMLDVAGASAPLDKARELAARVAEQLRTAIPR